MSNMKPILFLAAAFSLAACSQDEPNSLAEGALPGGKRPLVLTAALPHEAVATPREAGKRSTVDGDWTDALSVAVQVGDRVKEYTTTEASGDAAKLTCATITEDDTGFWWTMKNETKAVCAWYPYSEAMPAKWTVSPAQTEETLAREDLLYAHAEITRDDPHMPFEHVLSLVEVNLEQSAYLQNASQVAVKLVGTGTSGDFQTDSEGRASFTGVEQGDVTPCEKAAPDDNDFASYRALVVPDGVQGERTLQVVVDGVAYTASKPATCLPGYRYTYRVTVREQGLEVSVAESIGWNGTSGTGGVALEDSYDPATNTYYAYTADGLDEWAEMAKTNATIGCILMDDIRYDNGTWTPVGDADSGYTGTFDGGGHTISQMQIADGGYAGLFGHIGAGGTVRDVKFKDINVSQGAADGYAGIIAGRNAGSITRCQAEDCTVEAGQATNSRAGGIAGENSAEIVGCSFDGSISISADGYGGGIVGMNSGDIRACWADTNFSDNGIKGGVCGDFLNGKIYACYWGGNATAGCGQNLFGSLDDTYKVDGNFYTWIDAAAHMSAELGPDFGLRWQTSDPNTPPTLVPNN